MYTIDNLANIYYSANKIKLDEFLSGQEAADKIGIKLCWLQDKRNPYNQILNPVRVGRYKYYSVDNIEDAINNTVKYITQKQTKKELQPAVTKLVKKTIIKKIKLKSKSLKKKVFKEKVEEINSGINTDDYYNTAEVAQLTGWALRTLYNRRNLRMSPEYIKHNGRAYYPKKDIDILVKSKSKI